MNSVSAKGLFNRGAIAYQNKKYDVAAKAFETLLAVSDKQPQTWQYLIASYAHSQNIEKAHHALKCAGKLFGNQPWMDELALSIHRASRDAGKEYALLIGFINRPNPQSEHIRRAIDIAGALEYWKDGEKLLNRLERIINVKYTDILKAKIHFYRAAEKWDLSLKYSEEYINLITSDDSALNEHAVLLRLNGFAQESRDLLLILLSRHQHYAVFHNYANAVSDLGELLEAAEYYQKAIVSNPRYIDSFINLSRIRWELGDRANFVNHFEQYLIGASADFIFAYIYRLLEAKQFEQVREKLETFSQYKTDLRWGEYLAASYRNAGNFEKAEEVYQKLTKVQSLPHKLRIEHAVNLIELNKAEDAAVLLKSVIDYAPDNQLALAYLHIARRMLGGPTIEVSAHVAKYDAFPEYIEDQKCEFLALIRTYLRQIHSAVAQPINQSLENGTQTRGHLFSSPHPLIQEVKKHIDATVFKFIEEQGMDKSKLTMSDGSPNYVGSWSVKLNGQGYHRNHIHSNGRISGVIYFSVPEETKDEDSKQGWLTLGQPYSYQPAKIAPDFQVMPEPLYCVLFKSFLWHGTNPFETSKERLTIAFDVGEYGKF